MSKKEYADQTRTYTAYFRAGEHQERERILALIKEKIKELKPYGKTGDSHGINILKELEKEVENDIKRRNKKNR